jgi:DNA-nicking Smr family endonuclease
VPPGELTPKQYRIYLINDTTHDLAVKLELYVGGHQVDAIDDLLASSTFKACGYLQYDDLNEVPEFDIVCQRLTTDGSAGIHEKTVKIKPGNFFKNLKAAPLLSREAHVVMLIEKPESDPADHTKGESLSEYTKRNIRKQPSTPKKASYLQVHDLHAKAAFDNEIDLHIEKLTADHSRMSNTEMITLQLRRFDDFLARAVRLGIDRAFVIHGVGKGVLRDEIHRKLRHNQHVIDYKNEFHHKYGWGATEVILK